ncbi:MULTISPECIES: hypothetical protein [unclassified Bacillus (in: firmicutes)]|uniref:hypothetical protein n=1 Tax=unclassified Bacillus (in: firmicutes) TaxID=185979 RepID=UPI00227FA6F8|nr:hypothetical protein [Bacillus sp. S20C3]MCY8290267.1 hypothetical protein [Bacillus sp. N13C7]MCY8638757.1 hypothetical protein [Bacillus sp. S17B2]MCY9144785.1 hypothetical protein [Bacillus sp. T9C1]
MLEGKQKCQYEDCMHDFEWFYHVPDHIDKSTYSVHVRPRGKEPLYKIIEWDENRIPIKATAYCTFCDRLNTFEPKIDVFNK